MIIFKMKSSNNRGDSYADITNYIKYNIESTERGHIIKIVTQSGVHTYNCKWQSYKRPRGLTKSINQDSTLKWDE